MCSSSIAKKKKKENFFDKKCVLYIKANDNRKSVVVYMYIGRSVSCLRPLEVRSCLYFLPLSLLDLLLCVLFLFPLSEGLYHCCTAIIEKSRKDTWQMFGERCFQIHLCLCLSVSATAGL